MPGDPLPAWGELSGSLRHMATVKYLGEMAVYLPGRYRWIAPGDTLEVPEEEVETFTRREDFVEVTDEPPAKLTHIKSKSTKKESETPESEAPAETEGESE